MQHNRIDAPAGPSAVVVIRTLGGRFSSLGRAIVLSILCICFVSASGSLPALAESGGAGAAPAAGSAAILNVVRWNGSLPEAAGRTIESEFALYQDQTGGLALWKETQTVKVGADGRFSVLLGATSAEGLPQTLFLAGEARWIEVRVAGLGGEAASRTPGARSLLAAVPYALKSVDSDALAGRAAADYVTREDLQSAVAASVQTAAEVHPEVSPTGSGTQGYVPLWTGTSTLGSSVIAQSGMSVGVGTAAPATTLDVAGASTLRGSVTITAPAAATPAAGVNSSQFSLNGSGFVSGGAAENLRFGWETAVNGNNTASPSALLEILFASGNNGFSNTSLTFSPTGNIYTKGTMTLGSPAATAAAGVASPRFLMQASSFNSSTTQSVPQGFAFSAVPAGNNTASPSANLALLFGTGSIPAATGLSFSHTGIITFAPGQTFPVSGFITGVSAGTDLTGGGTSGNVTLNVDTTKVVTGVTAGTGLTGGGAGGTPALAVDTSAVPLLKTNNIFTGGDTFEVGIEANGVGGPGGGFSGGGVGTQGQAGVTAFGGSDGISGVQVGGPAFSGTGGAGVGGNNTQGGGDGIDATGGTSSYVPSIGGAGGSLTGANSGPEIYGGNGVNATGGKGEQGGYGVYAYGGDAVVGCGNLCSAGAGGVFSGGGGAATNGGDGVIAYAGVQGGTGITAVGCSGYSDSTNCLYAGLFLGDVDVEGNVHKSGGSFKIDHPLDPENKYLYHSFVESPDMKNVYDGTVVTDGGGRATVTLPDWFEALNSDFRYQLTVIGQFAQAIVDSEISNNAFTIRTDKPDVKVSWQVTGIRQDAWAKAHRIPVEEEKGKADQGHYLHPELFGHGGEPSIGALHHPHPARHKRT